MFVSPGEECHRTRQTQRVHGGGGGGGGAGGVAGGRDPPAVRRDSQGGGGGPGRTPKGREYHKTMTCQKNPTEFLTRTFTSHQSRIQSAGY